jgi:hypothetical protein
MLRIYRYRYSTDRFDMRTALSNLYGYSYKHSVKSTQIRRTGISAPVGFMLQPSLDASSSKLHFCLGLLESFSR